MFTVTVSVKKTIIYPIIVAGRCSFGVTVNEEIIALRLTE